MSLEVVHEFSYWVALKPAVDFGRGPFGRRVYFEVADGAANGERFNATADGGGGVWILLGTDGYGRVDVRAQLQTNDGAHVYCHFFGLLELNSAVSHALANGQGMTFDDEYVRSSPRCEPAAHTY